MYTQLLNKKKYETDTVNNNNSLILFVSESLIRLKGFFS